MKFVETELAGAFVIRPEPVIDERGFFSRAFCRREFEQHGLNADVAQCNMSFNRNRGTLRGMHYQVRPHQEVKLVRCVAGSVYDVIVDLRRESRTYGKWLGVELNADNRNMVYVPAGFAHGYLTLSDNAEIFYQVSEFYSKAHERGLRWNDPAFGIEWPFTPTAISEKDRSFPDFEL